MAKLSKTQKKTDTSICKALTAVCEDALKEQPGFAWITHQADYSNFPASLFITCVFERDDDLIDIEHNGIAEGFRKKIHAKLLKAGIRLMQAHRQVQFDSEEACLIKHGGDWAKRLNTHKGLALNKNRPKHAE